MPVSCSSVSGPISSRRRRRCTSSATVIERDRGQLEALARSLPHALPALDAAHEAERAAALELERCEQALAAWQLARMRTPTRWPRVSARPRSSAPGSSSWTTSSTGCCSSASGRSTERAALAQAQPAAAFETLAEQAALAREAGEKAGAELAELLAELAAAREQEREQTEALNALRARWQGALGRQVSTEALQQAALGKASGKVTQWLKSQALDRIRASRSSCGWSTAGREAVETVLGSYLEAVCVEGLDGIADVLGGFDGGHLAVVSRRRRRGAVRRRRPSPLSLKAKVQGAAYLALGAGLGVHRRDACRSTAHAASAGLAGSRW